MADNPTSQSEFDRHWQQIVDLLRRPILVIGFSADGQVLLKRCHQRNSLTHAQRLTVIKNAAALLADDRPVSELMLGDPIRQKAAADLLLECCNWAAHDAAEDDRG